MDCNLQLFIDVYELCTPISRSSRGSPIAAICRAEINSRLQFYLPVCVAANRVQRISRFAATGNYLNHNRVSADWQCEIVLDPVSQSPLALFPVSICFALSEAWNFDSKSFEYKSVSARNPVRTWANKGTQVKYKLIKAGRISFTAVNKLNEIQWRLFNALYYLLKKFHKRVSIRCSAFEILHQTPKQRIINK